MDVVATKKYTRASQRNALNFGSYPSSGRVTSRCHCISHSRTDPFEAPGQLSIWSPDYPAEALRQHRLGTAQLIYQGDLKTAKYLKKQLFRDNASMLSFAGAQIDRDTWIDGLVVEALAIA